MAYPELPLHSTDYNSPQNQFSSTQMIQRLLHFFSS